MKMSIADLANDINEPMANFIGNEQWFRMSLLRETLAVWKNPKNKKLLDPYWRDWANFFIYRGKKEK